MKGCTVGDNIQPENLRQGTGGYEPCKNCLKFFKKKK